jgi:subtilisin family serine protease
MRKPTVLAVLLLGAAACQDATSPRPIAAPPAGVNAAANSASADYIVTLRGDETDPDGQARALVAAHGGSLTHVYRTALKGFAVANLPDAAAAALERNPRVAGMERDGVVSIVGSGTQSSATWGIDRIDQRDRPLDGTYSYDADGTGVTVYIIDTGIRTAHNEFGGRASGGFTAINDGNGSNDCNGHGTHVAGTVGGSTYGVAQNVSLVAVRVLNCSGSGTTSGVIAGIDWVTANRAAASVANMSLGGGFSSTLNAAVSNSIAAGVTYAVAAGNSNANACNYSPASAPAAITVGSTTSSDGKSSFSNGGTCVDINAPGSSITSAWSTSNTATNTISGTSMASPHVAGAAAAYLSANPGSSPAAIASALNSSATVGRITGLGSGTPNRLLYTHFASVEPEPDPEPDPSPAPVASFSKSCSGFSCTFRSTSTGSITTYAWTFGNGETSSAAAPPTIDYAARQNYTVTLVVTGPGGTSSPASQNVNCNPKRCQ